VKRSMLALGVMTVLFAFAGPAEAKGAIPQSAEITGPGLHRPLIFGDPTPYGVGTADGSVFLLADETHFLDAIYGGGGISAQRPEGKLGPAYTVIWKLRREFQTRGTFTMRSELYPFAPHGAVMYTHGGPTVHEGKESFVLRGGWSDTNPVLVQNLHAWGLPKQQVASEPSAATTSAIAPWSVMLIAAIGLIALTVIKLQRAGEPPRTA
jgi:hypothetical protein